MSTPKRLADASVIQQLLDDPSRFEFFQTLKILLHWLDSIGAADPAGHLRFHHRTDAAFPASEVVALWSRTSDNREIAFDWLLEDAIRDNPTHAVNITPAAIGMLGNNGPMPAHYTHSIADAVRKQHDIGPRAFIDMLANRATLQFYQAWARYRTDCQPRDGNPFLALQSALSGCPPPSGNPVSCLNAETIAYYTPLFQRRPVTAESITGALSDYFAAPVRFESFVGDWYLRKDLAQLGVANCTLGQGAMLGERCHRADLAAEIRIGPLTRQQYGQFLPEGDASRALSHMLAMFGVVAVRYRVRLILRGCDVVPCHLAATIENGESGLGQGMFLGPASIARDRDDLCYDIIFPGSAGKAGDDA